VHRVVCSARQRKSGARIDDADLASYASTDRSTIRVTEQERERRKAHPAEDALIRQGAVVLEPVPLPMGFGRKAYER
jgi:hypothetical protein